MKWQTKEVELYLQASEYVDTAVISLIPIAWENDIKSTVQMGEFTSLLSDELERQFKGRVFQFPPYTYLKGDNLEERLLKINEYDKYLKKCGFRHIIYLTSDIEWKQIEKDMNDLLLWTPTIPFEQVDQKGKMDILSNQIKQMLPLLMNKWQKVQNEG